MDTWIIESPTSERFPWLTRANAGEVLPDPVTPLGWTLAWAPGVLRGWATGYVSFGCFRPEEVADDPPPVGGVFGGYYYNNMSAARLNGARMPGLTVEAFDAAFFGDHAGVPPYEPHPDDPCPECTATLTERMGWVLSAETWPELDDDKTAAERARRDRPDLASLGDAELVARARDFVPWCARGFERHVWASLGSSVGPGIVGAILGGLGQADLTMELFAGIGGVDSAVPANRLWELSRQVRSSAVLTALFDAGAAGVLERARAADGEEVAGFLAAVAGFLVEQGHRGPGEWDPGAPSWEVDPDLMLALVERIRLAGDEAAPPRQFEQRKARREELVVQVAEQLAGDPETQGTFLAAARSGARFFAARERTKSNSIRWINEIRVALYELGRRGVAAGGCEHPSDIFMLLDAELDAFLADPVSLAATIRERKAQYLDLFTLEPPFFLDEPVPLSAMARKRPRSYAEQLAVGEAIQGASGCPGHATGRARIVLDPSDPSALEPGDVLVAPVTDPSWTPLFVLAAAVVVDVGAANSHAVIVSRELGIPCVVSAADATRRIPDGAEVTVDGATGLVTIVG